MATTTTTVRADHTHWLCRSLLVTGNYCNHVNEMKDKTCQGCGVERDVITRALTEAWEDIGKLVSKDSRDPLKHEWTDLPFQAITFAMPNASVTTKRRGDHTHWRCNKIMSRQPHVRCVNEMYMAESICNSCNSERGVDSDALAANGDRLGVLVSKDTGNVETWHYVVVTNGITH
ncbi:hypothetical protein FSARC_6553 [Fusarium sarcochroum]|uniref:RanBP2-type domain-containing protein n=1 Tax=Fusarium sarcochroum TaxID=1208366 RepID=A0A8H4X889_9HYPO|nr:hypothetical protein FSARC_6553 [Fusarium sarcochroum]